MPTWTTTLEAKVKVDEELEASLMTALAAAFAEPNPGLALGSGRLVVRLEVEADLESEAAGLAAERFARALEKAPQDLLPLLERLESRRRRRRKSEGSARSDTAGWPDGVLLPIRPPSRICNDAANAADALDSHHRPPDHPLRMSSS